MLQIFIHDDAADDLNELATNEPGAAGCLSALLEQLAADPDLLDRLTQHDYGTNHTADFHVSKWQEHWRQGRDLWRLKVWDLEDRGLRYRIIYAFIPIKQHYHILAIAPRDFDYDTQHPISQRILVAYQEL